MDGGASQAVVHGITKSHTQLSKQEHPYIWVSESKPWKLRKIYISFLSNYMYHSASMSLSRISIQISWQGVRCISFCKRLIYYCITFQKSFTRLIFCQHCMEMFVHRHSILPKLSYFTVGKKKKNPGNIVVLFYIFLVTHKIKHCFVCISLFCALPIYIICLVFYCFSVSILLILEKSLYIWISSLWLIFFSMQV